MHHSFTHSSIHSFIGYNQCIDAFIERCQEDTFFHEEIHPDILQLCHKTEPLINEVGCSRAFRRGKIARDANELEPNLEASHARFRFYAKLVSDAKLKPKVMWRKTEVGENREIPEIKLREFKTEKI